MRVKNRAAALAKSSLPLVERAQNLRIGVENEHLAVCAVEPERKFSVARFQKKRFRKPAVEFALLAAHTKLPQDAVARAHKRNL